MDDGGWRFAPYYGKTQSVVSAAGAGNVTVASGSRAILVTNVGTVLIFARIKPSGSSVDASATDVPIPAGTSRVLPRSMQESSTQGETVVSIFAAGAGSTVYVTPGDVQGA